MGREARRDKRFFYILAPSAGTIILLFIVLFLIIFYISIPALRQYGIGLYTRNVWAPSETGPGDYGLLAPLFGTLVTSLISIIIVLPLSLSLIILTEEIIPPKSREIITSLVDVMAGLPTIIYGLWGVAILAPLLKKKVMDPLHTLLSSIPLFSCQPITGENILTAGILLAIMILPFVYVIIREAYSTIPHDLVEAAAAYSAGWRHYVRLRLGMIKPAIIGGLLLGFGRAAGETVAVALVVGNSFTISACLFKPGYTISALIANQFSNSLYYPLMLNVLFSGGFILLIIGLILNIIGLKMLKRAREYAQI